MTQKTVLPYLSILDQEYYDFCKTILKQKGAL
jgi:hypothetical protein